MQKRLYKMMMNSFEFIHQLPAAQLFSILLLSSIFSPSSVSLEALQVGEGGLRPLHLLPLTLLPFPWSKA